MHCSLLVGLAVAVGVAIYCMYGEMSQLLHRKSVPLLNLMIRAESLAWPHHHRSLQVKSQVCILHFIQLIQLRLHLNQPKDTLCICIRQNTPQASRQSIPLIPQLQLIKMLFLSHVLSNIDDVLFAYRMMSFQHAQPSKQPISPPTHLNLLHLLWPNVIRV